MILKGKYVGFVAVSLLFLLASDPASGQFFGGGNQRNNNSWGSGSGGRRPIYDSDAGDGGIIDYENVPPRPSGGGNQNNSDWLKFGIDLGVKAIDAAAQAERNRQRSERNNGGRSYRNDYDYYTPQQPRTYRPRPTPKPAVVKTNKPPKKAETKMALRSNQQSIGEGFELLSDEEAELLQQITQDNAEKQVDEIEKNLGETVKDPEVKKVLDKMRKDVEDGKSIDPADIKNLEDALNNSMFALPVDEKLNEAVKKAVKDSQINETLVDKLNDPNQGSGIPSGPTDVIFVPGLPADDITMFPDGSVVMGTGGQGELGITEVDASELVDFPVGAGEPVPDSTSDFDKRVTSGILLMNPESTGATIHYLLNDSNYSMAPKFSQALDESKKWTIRFDRSEGGGEAKYGLTAGTYAFGSSDSGWELYRQSFSVKIDNSTGEDTFYYNFNNTQAEVGPGKIASHTSDYPIFIRFDRGNGKEAKKKVISKSELFQVAVNPEDGYWELYPGNAEVLSVASTKESSQDGGSAKKPTSRAAKLRRLLLMSQKSG